jgi:hypothetical protein
MKYFNGISWPLKQQKILAELRIIGEEDIRYQRRKTLLYLRVCIYDRIIRSYSDYIRHNVRTVPMAMPTLVRIPIGDAKCSAITAARL